MANRKGKYVVLETRKQISTIATLKHDVKAA